MPLLKPRSFAWRARAALALGTCLALAATGLPQASAARAPTLRVKVLGGGLDAPSGLATDGQHLYVANSGNSSIVVMDLPSLSVRHVWAGPQYHLAAPTALALYGHHLWALSPAGEAGVGVLTELSTVNGQVQTVLDHRKYGISAPSAMVVDGGDLFVAEAGDGQVTELDAATGHLVRVLSGQQYEIAQPMAMAAIGQDVFVANDQGGAGGTITEIDATTGGLVQLISGVQYGFQGPSALAAYGPYLFVANSGPAGADIFAADRRGSSVMSLDNPYGSITELDPAGTAGTSTTTSTSVAGSTTTSTTTPIGTTSSTTTSVGTTTTTSTTTTAASTTTTTTPPGTPAPPFATLVRTISSPDVEMPESEVVVGNSLFVTALNEHGAAVVQLDAATGDVLHVQAGSQAGLGFSSSMAVADGKIFVANVVASDISVLDASDDALAGVTTGSSYQLNVPLALSVADGHLFALNEPVIAQDASANLSSLSSTITEVDAATGAFQRLLRAPQDKFGFAASMTSSAGKLFVPNYLEGTLKVVNAHTGTVEEVWPAVTGGPKGPSSVVVAGPYVVVGYATGDIAVRKLATGRLVKLIRAKTTHLGVVLSMAWGEGDLFVGSEQQDLKGATVLDLDLATGSVVSSLAGAKYNFDLPESIAIDGGHVFVTSEDLQGGTGSLLELDEATGALTGKLSGAATGLELPRDLTVSGDRVYVGDMGSDDVTEVEARTGDILSVLSGQAYGFNAPSALTVWHHQLFVANSASDSISDVSLPS